MKTLIMTFCLMMGIILLGGCMGIIATDYVEMGVYIRTANEISGMVKGRSYCFLPEEGQEESKNPTDYLEVLREQFGKIGMKEVSKPEGADFVVVVAYGEGETELILQLPERQIRTGGRGVLGGAGYIEYMSDSRDNFIIPTASSETTMGGGATAGKVNVLALALIEGKEWWVKGDASRGCYSGTVVVYGGGGGVKELFPRMAGYLFEGFPGKKVSERVVTFRMRAGEGEGKK